MEKIKNGNEEFLANENNKNESLIVNNINPDTSKINNSLYINEYDECCEEFSKIEKIQFIKYSPIKIVFFVIMNFFTAFLINLLIIWYPKLKMVFLYSQTNCKNAKFVQIYGKG